MSNWVVVCTALSTQIEFFHASLLFVAMYRMVIMDATGGLPGKAYSITACTVLKGNISHM